MTQSNKSKPLGENEDTHASEQAHCETDKMNPSLNYEDLLNALFQALQKLLLQGRRIIYFVMCELGGNEMFEAAASWCAHHPDIAICLLAASFVFLLPLLLIFGFGIITLAITFTGILVLEGTLLTVVFMIFFACIGSLAIAVIVFAVVAYFGFAQIYGFLGMERYRDTFIRFIQERSVAEPNERL